MQVDYHIFHLGIVNRALRSGAPCFFGAVVIREDTDDFDGVEIGEVEAARIADATAEDEMELAHESTLPCEESRESLVRDAAEGEPFPAYSLPLDALAAAAPAVDSAFATPSSSLPT